MGLQTVHLSGGKGFTGQCAVPPCRGPTAIPLGACSGKKGEERARIRAWLGQVFDDSDENLYLVG